MVRPFEPSIADAFKLNAMPKIDDTVQISPHFEYNLTLRPLKTDMTLNPIPSARMVSEPIPKAYLGYAKAGLDIFASPMAELYINSKRSKTFSFGAWAKHLSSFQGVSIDTNRVDADYSRSNFAAYGKTIFGKSALDAEAGFSHHRYLFYGYDTTNIGNPSVESGRGDAQKQQNAYVRMGFHSTHNDSAHLNYKFNAGFRSFIDGFGMEESTFTTSADLDRFFRNQMVGGVVEFTHHMRSIPLDTANNTIVRIAPWIGLFGKQWRVRAGLNFTYDSYATLRAPNFYPIASLSYDIVSNYVIPYFEFSGYLEDNNYLKLLNENPWAAPGLKVYNTSHKMIVSGGVKGNFSTRAAYNLSASYSLVDSMYFWMNLPHDSSALVLGNRFGVEVDSDVQRKQFAGELTIAPTPRLSFYLLATYNAYTLVNVEKPWHRPDYTGRFMATYNIKDKIIARASVVVEGKRWARQANGNAIQLDGFVDANLGLEYRFGPRLSVWLDVNNLAAQRRHLYYLYPMQGFNVRIGGGLTF